jgi:hypothetical protein
MSEQEEKAGIAQPLQFPAFETLDDHFGFIGVDLAIWP